MADAPLAPGAAPSPAPVPPVPGAPAPETPPVPPAPAPEPTDESIKLSSTQLNERLERARAAERTKLLKSMGFESEDQAKQVREEAERRRQASLTREQQLEEENTRLKAERDAATAAQTAAEFDRELAVQCSTLKITDVEYARYLVASGKIAKEGIGAFLTEQTKDDRKKVSLGLVEAAPVPVPTPITTLPGGGRAPAPVPAPNGQGGVKDVFSMTSAEFEAHVRTHHS